MIAIKANFIFVFILCWCWCWCWNYFIMVSSIKLVQIVPISRIYTVFILAVW